MLLKARTKTTTWGQRRTTGPSLKEPGLLDKLIADLLQLVLQQVFLSDLLNLCLISRHLYINTVPHLYRGITFDFTRASHVQLLFRLSRPESRLPGLLREIGIKSIKGDHVGEEVLLQMMSVVFSALKRVESFWCSTDPDLHMPLFILDALYDQSPRAETRIFATEENAVAIEKLAIHSALTHSAGCRITAFYFHAYTIGEMYDDFKKLLLTMLSQNQVLNTLSISTNASIRRTYPEMLKQFRESSLPKPAHLDLRTDSELFTRRELNIWGAKHGFENVTTLELCGVDKLTCFVDRTPKLNTLKLFDGCQEEWDVLDEHLNFLGSQKPFGSVRQLRFVGYFAPLVQQPLQTARPWCLLDGLTDVKILDLARYQLDLGSLSPCLFAPTVNDIRRLRTLYPNLKKFSLDIALQGPYAEWRSDVLTELARFEEPLVITMYLHRAPTKRARFMNNRMDYLSVGTHILKERVSLGLPFCYPFKLEFKVVKPWAEMKTNWDTPDYWVYCYNGVYGAYAISSWSQKDNQCESIDRMLVQDLKTKAAKQVTMKLLGWDRKGYEKELRRRECRTGVGQEYTGAGTLYDLWMT